MPQHLLLGPISSTHLRHLVSLISLGNGNDFNAYHAVYIHLYSNLMQSIWNWVISDILFMIKSLFFNFYICNVGKFNNSCSAKVLTHTPSECFPVQICSGASAHMMGSMFRQTWGVPEWTMHINYSVRSPSLLAVSILIFLLAAEGPALLYRQTQSGKWRGGAAL